MRRDVAIAYLWESGRLGARLLRALLWPFGWLYGVIIELRTAASICFRALRAFLHVLSSHAR